MENQYRIVSTIISEDAIQVNVLHNDVCILNKFLMLDLNGDKTPTFANSRLPYNEQNMDNLINSMIQNTDYIFAFECDDEDEEDEHAFDGMFYHDGHNDIPETLIIKVVNGKLNMAIH